MRLLAGNVWARVEAAAAEISWLDRYLCVDDPDREHSVAFQMGAWDGKVRYLKEGEFPSGFVRLVAARAREEGIPCEVVDERAVPPFTPVVEAGTWLRQDQEAALEQMLVRKRGIVSLPTAFGKTELIAAAVQAVPLRWLVLVDTRDLLHQTAERIQQRIGERVGRVGDGQWDVRRVTVATVQTLAPRMRERGDAAAELGLGAEGVIVDEVQILPGPQAYGLVMALDRAYYRFGLSATPLERTDRRAFHAIGALGPLIVDVPVPEAQAAGVIARSEVRMVRFRHPKRLTGEYDAIYHAAVVINEARNEMIADVVADPALCPRPTIVFTKARTPADHGYLLKCLLERRLVRTDYVHGGHQSHRRKSAIHDLSRGHSEVLVCTNIFKKGIDIPAVASMFNAAGGRSREEAVQKLGRGLRVSEGKDRLIYYDVWDDNVGVLVNQAKERAESYRSRGQPVRVLSLEDLRTPA